MHPAPDESTLAALEATLHLYLHPEALSKKYRPCACLPAAQRSFKSRHNLYRPPLPHITAQSAVQVMPCLSQIGGRR
ncbi:hypothetical protein ACLK18_20455 [Escherichia coli]